MTEKHIRQYQRAQCIALRRAGMSCRAIAEDVGVSRASVQRSLERYDETGGFQDRSRSGRPKKFNDRNIRKPICRRTVINYLQKFGYEYKVKIEKPYLSKQHRNGRLQWCLEHSNWTVDDWKKVLFSDESTFYVVKRKSETKIWRTKDEKWREGCMAVAATGGGGRAGFWGVITWKGAGCFRIYTENTNSEVYCNILDNYLVPTVQMYGFENDFLLQHDNGVITLPIKLKKSYKN
ncbi:unnamed protein product [Adineta ricciae]|uniref:Transposase Tc1-like domain-containing protein n=1 Tax=Adineta ricciae TaxID=249248 RepID=A0A815LV36_ADIRI|nr:unnamed protein product [Adineta ricciae]